MFTNVSRIFRILKNFEISTHPCTSVRKQWSVSGRTGKKDIPIQLMPKKVRKHNILDIIDT